MPQPSMPESKPMQGLRRLAMQYPETEEGICCNKCAFRARGKAFLFMGSDATSYNLMFKLRESLPEAARYAAEHPDRCAAGGHNWVKAIFPHNESPPRGLRERWIDESYRLLAPKQLAAGLPTRKLTGGKTTGPAKAKRAGKKARD